MEKSVYGEEHPFIRVVDEAIASIIGTHIFIDIASFRPEFGGDASDSASESASRSASESASESMTVSKNIADVLIDSVVSEVVEDLATDLLADLPTDLLGGDSSDATSERSSGVNSEAASDVPNHTSINSGNAQRASVALLEGGSFGPKLSSLLSQQISVPKGELDWANKQVAIGELCKGSSKVMRQDIRMSEFLSGLRDSRKQELSNLSLKDRLSG